MRGVHILKVLVGTIVETFVIIRIEVEIRDINTTVRNSLVAITPPAHDGRAHRNIAM